SGRDVRAWSAAWLETSGVSTLWTETDASGAVLVQDPPRPHRLRVGLYAFAEDALVLREQRELDIAEARAPPDLPDADLVLLNDGDLSYVKARLDERSTDAAERALSTIEDSLARGLVWSS